VSVRNIRALLLPLGVALLAVAGLGWYNFIWIPAQQRFLNERNFRLLRTLSAQIEGKVNNFDRALDHTFDSIGNAAQSDDSSKLGQFIRMFAPEIELLAKPDTSAARLVHDDASDPPRVLLEREEGRSFLYIGLQHGTQPAIVAKADVGTAIGKFLAPGDEFDALLLVDREGVVIDQRSPIGLELARVDQLPNAGARPALTGDKNAAEAAPSFKSLRMSNNSTDVLVGDASYKLYVQPILLSLVRVDARRAVAPEERKKALVDEPEEWALCGLVRSDKFRAASSAISYTYLLWLSAALAGVFCAIPLLKLRVLSPHERLTHTDGVLISVAAFFVMGLIAFAVFDVYYFGRQFANRTDAILTATADTLNKSAAIDISEVNDEMDALNDALNDTFARTGEPLTADARINVGDQRSEERRVGKECRSRWSPYH